MPTHPAFAHYPSPDQVDAWADGIAKEARELPLTVKTADQPGLNHIAPRHFGGTGTVSFTLPGLPGFHGYWQQAFNTPAPLLVHVPGYGAEMSIHPELTEAGYNVLHINPLGYCTPDGFDTSLGVQDAWPVLPQTVTSGAREGYRLWLLQAAAAVLWALRKPEVTPDRLSFFGTSQGGGGALLLASVFKDHPVRCVAADVPFLTAFPLQYDNRQSGAYNLAFDAVDAADDTSAAWHAVGHADTVSHVHRLHIPVLLTAGGNDLTCPAASIEYLFSRLTNTRSYTWLQGQLHAYTQQFITLARAWFRLHA